MITNLSVPLEDCLESIYIIQNQGKMARIKDLAEFLDIKASSVFEFLEKLQKEGLVTHEKYGHIELTSQGLSFAKKIYGRHDMLKKFFHQFLGVAEPTAEEDACKIEHYLSKETIRRILKFIKFMKDSPKEMSKWTGGLAAVAKNGS